MGLELRGVFAGLAGLVLLAPPAGAQRNPLEIALSQDQAVGAVTVLGDVRAEIHQKSMMAKTPSRELADQQLREKAAKMGADAVIGIKYENNNPVFSKKGFIATGKAVRFASTQVASAAPIPATPVAAPPAAPAPTVFSAPPPPALAAAPSFSAAGAPPALAAQTVPLPSAPAASVAPSSSIALSEGNSGRQYTVVGPVNAALDQLPPSLDKTGRQILDDELRAQATRLGADAVLMIRYSPASTGRAPSAIGVAVKFK